MKMWKVLWTILGALFFVLGVCAAVYYLNLDQKLMDWVYAQIRRIRGGAEEESREGKEA